MEFCPPAVSSVSAHSTLSFLLLRPASLGSPFTSLFPTHVGLLGKPSQLFANPARTPTSPPVPQLLRTLPTSCLALAGPPTWSTASSASPPVSFQRGTLPTATSGQATPPVWRPAPPYPRPVGPSPASSPLLPGVLSASSNAGPPASRGMASSRTSFRSWPRGHLLR